MDAQRMAALADSVTAREARAIARAISLVEAGAPEVPALMASLAVRNRAAYRIGVTGPPGAGKSTVVNRLIAAFRARGLTVAVLAVDPSSPRTGGAVLGDRVRMQQHAADAGVFIRSMATRGRLGGLSAASDRAAAILEAAGFDVVIIETVGVGQDEVDIVRAADVSLLTLVPGTGDEVQALKAGVMEVADIFVINKADLAGAEAAAAAVEGTLALETRAADRWRPPVLRVSAASGEGIPALVDALEQFRARAGDLVAWRAARDGRVRAAGVALDHVALATESVAATAELFRELFGLAATAIEQVPAHHVRVQFVETAGARLELLEPTGPESAVARFLARRGSGLHHIALRVTDLESLLASLRDRGVRLIDERPRPGAGGTTVAFVHPSSTGGVLVELVARENGDDAAG
jgi:LAO/AO transport system kinase